MIKKYILGGPTSLRIRNTTTAGGITVVVDAVLNEKPEPQRLDLSLGLWAHTHSNERDTAGCIQQLESIRPHS